MVKVAHVDLDEQSWRIVSASTGAFERLASTAEQQAQARALLSVAQQTLIERARRHPGWAPILRRPGWEIILAPFAGPVRYPSRFSDGAFGVYYGSFDAGTAIAETVYHRTLLLRASNAPPTYLPVDTYQARVRGILDDLRGRRTAFAEIYSPDNYRAAQVFGKQRFEAGSNGIAYDSVRRHGGACVGVLAPETIGACRRSAQLRYRWDGTSIVEVLRVERPASY